MSSLRAISGDCEAALPAHVHCAEVVRISAGLIQGESLPGGVRAFRGIPFAQPPVGELRWRPPQPVRGWAGVKQCVAFGPACVQVVIPGVAFAEREAACEDCLYLNVWTPAQGDDAALPVMVWLHGGGYLAGAASDDFYDGQDLARKNVVVVTCNYRLGPFGFLAHPMLSRESPQGISGNYGLMDQIAVLEWVRDNIRAFGGDSERVTVFGESAGGRSIALLMVSPQANGLFHRAVMQSSTIYRPIQHLREVWYGRPAMESVGEFVAQAAGCSGAADPLAALRACTAEELLSASSPSLPGFVPGFASGVPYEPIVDGWLVPDDPSDLFDAGKQHKMPLIAGANADEGTLFIQGVDVGNPERVRRLICAAFPEHAEEVLRLYPFSTPQDAYQALNQISGDASSLSPMRSVVRSMERAGEESWFYRFSHVRSDMFGRRFGAYHGSEIRFVFNNLDRGLSRVVEADRHVADMMSSYWVNFAATGNPNADGVPHWPVYTRTEERYMEFGDHFKAGQKVRPDFCDLFASIEQTRRLKRRSDMSAFTMPLMRGNASFGKPWAGIRKERSRRWL